jgi:hypothetical protein
MIRQRIARLTRQLAGTHAERISPVPDDPALEALLHQHFVTAALCTLPTCLLCRPYQHYATLSDAELCAEISFTHRLDAVALKRFGVCRQGVIPRDALAKVAMERGIACSARSFTTENRT